MAVVVGTLQVNVTTGQATLTFDDAKSQMDAFGKSAADAGQKLDYSMRESHESIMLTAEAMGVHLPAGITRVIAGLGPLGAALAAALPAAAIVAGISLIISHYEKLAEAISKAQAEAAKSAITNADETKSIELTNLKLDDQIAKLEHKPTHNFMAEAILEASKDVDDLLGKYSSDMAKMTTITEDQTHFWISLWRGVKDAFSGVGQGQGYGTVTKQWEDLKQKILDVQNAQKSLAEAPLDSKSQVAGRDAVIAALKAEQAAIAGLQVIYRNNKQQLIELGEQALNVATELKNLNLVIDEGAKKKEVASLTQNNDNLLPLQQEAALHKIVAAGIKAHEDALRKLTETQDSLGTSGKEGLDAELAGIEANRSAAVAAADSVLKQQEADRAADVLAAGNDFAKVAETNATFTNEMQAHNDAVRQADAAAKAASEKAKLAAALEAIKTELDARVKAAESAMTAAAKTAQETTEVEKTQNTQAADDIATKEKLGLISKRQAFAETIALLNQEYAERQAMIEKERADEEAANAAKIKAEQDAAAALLAVNGGNKEDARYKEYLIEINALLAQQAELEKKAAADSAAASNVRNAGIEKTQQEAAALNNSWASYFTKMNQETNTLAATFRGTLQTSMTNAMNSFNNSVAKSIVEGKNFGQAMRQVAASFLENMIEAGLRWLENWIIQHTIAAAFANSSAAASFATQKAEAVSLAGANGVASFALAPFPIDLGAPAFGAAMAAAALGFNEGGIVPGVGNSDSVHAILTPGETVLPQAMTERLSNASDGGSQHHYHYSPTNNIKAWDSSDMKEELMKHKSEFFKEARRESRRRSR